MPRGPMTRWTSRAWKRNAIRPRLRSAHSPGCSTVQSPESAHWLSFNRIRRDIGATARRARHRRETQNAHPAHSRDRSRETPRSSSRPEPPSHRGERDQIVTDAVASGLAQQPLDDPLALHVSTLAELVVPDSPFRVGDVHGRPVPVVEGRPDGIVAVEGDRIFDVHVLRRPAHVVDVLFRTGTRACGRRSRSAPDPRTSPTTRGRSRASGAS